MKIVINSRLLIKNKLDGIGWFTYHTLKNITEQHSEHEFVFVFDRPFNPEFVFNKNVTPIVVSPPTRHPFLWYYWFEHKIPKILKNQKADIFLSTDGYLSLNTNVKSVPVIHDINFAHQPEDLPFFTRKYYNHYFPKFAQKAQRIATVSEYSKQDIAKTYNINPDLIDVVYNGSNSIYKPISEEQKLIIKQKYSAGCNYFIFIGNLSPRKNLPRLFLAFDKFKKQTSSNFKLIIVGSEMFKNSELYNVHSKMQYAKDVIFAGRLSPEDLQNVLASAFAMTFVPYFEGFGIPIIESMNCDVPVLTSNTTSMPEVAGDACILIDPFSVDSITKGIVQIYENDSLRKQLIEKSKTQRLKFSWTKTSEKLWQTIEKSL